MEQAPAEITVCHLEVVVMPNGEIICRGRSIGWVAVLGKYLTVVDACRPREHRDWMRLAANDKDEA